MNINDFKKVCEYMPSTQCFFLLRHGFGSGVMETLKEICVNTWKQKAVVISAPDLVDEMDVNSVLASIDAQEPVSIIISEYNRSSEEIQGRLVKALFHNYSENVAPNSKIIFLENSEIDDTFRKVDYAVFDKFAVYNIVG